jgi:hypothetical protein
MTPNQLTAIIGRMTPGEAVVCCEHAILYKGDRCWMENNGAPSESADMDAIAAIANHASALVECAKILHQLHNHSGA